MNSGSFIRVRCPKCGQENAVYSLQDPTVMYRRTKCSCGACFVNGENLIEDEEKALLKERLKGFSTEELEEELYQRYYSREKKTGSRKGLDSFSIKELENGLKCRYGI